MKKNIIITNIGLSLTIIGLLGFIFYDKVLNNDQKKDINCNQVNNGDEEENETSRVAQILTESTPKHVYTFGEFIVTKNGDVYFIPGDTYRIVSDPYPVHVKNPDILGVKKSYILDDYVGYLGDKIEFEGYKLDLSNILSVNALYFGNGAPDAHYVFISKEGNVSELVFEFDYNDNTLIAKFEKNISEYKNIVSIVPTSSPQASGAIVIDRDGNQYKYLSINILE